MVRASTLGTAYFVYIAMNDHLRAARGAGVVGAEAASSAAVACCTACHLLRAKPDALSCAEVGRRCDECGRATRADRAG
jgi:hypothetical protein